MTSDEAIDQAVLAKKNKQAVSIGVCCNAVALLERLLERNIVPDTLTDQTSAHDPLIGYWPHQLILGRSENPARNKSERIYRSCL